MKTPYEIVRFEPGFKAQVLALQRHLWSPDADLNAAYLQWKYEQNPYENRPLIYLSLHSGDVVGMLGMYGSRWEAGDSAGKATCLCGGDLVIAPGHRGRGLFPRMMAVAVEDLAALGYGFLFSLSAAKVTYLQCARMGWLNAGCFDAIRREPQPCASDNSSSAASPAAGPQAFAAFDRRATTPGPRFARCVSVASHPRPVAMAELIERIGADGRLRHVRDQEYLAWRFQNPLCAYRFLFWQDAKPQGYLVLQTPARRGASAIQIVDWEASCVEARADLLRAAVEWAGTEGLSIWSASLSPATLGLLEDAGFRPEVLSGASAGFRPALLVRPLANATPDPNCILLGRRLLDRASWDLRMIYSDRY